MNERTLLQGLIHLGGNRYKRHILPPRRSKVRNRYYELKQCAVCQSDCLQESGNAKRAARAICSMKCKKAMQSNSIGQTKRKRGRFGGPVLFYLPDHPAAKKGFVYEHRLVVEKAIGRYLRRDEYVHHIDCDQANNAIENLVVLTDAGHKKAHASIVKLIPELVRVGAVVFDHSAGMYRVVGQL